jgi:hypothetical protein
MILRMLNLLVIGVLILAAAYVYRIKFDSTVQAERLARIRSEVRRERDTVAALLAEWGKLQNPARVEALAKHYLPLKPIAPTQFDQLGQLPERPPQIVKPDSADPIGAVIENLEEPTSVTGSVEPTVAPPAATPPAATPPGATPPDEPTEAEAAAPKAGRLDR